MYTPALTPYQRELLEKRQERLNRLRAGANKEVGKLLPAPKKAVPPKEPRWKKFQKLYDTPAKLFRGHPDRRPPPTKIMPDLVLRHVVAFYPTTVEEIEGSSRASNITHYRHVAMYLVARLIPLSLSQIGCVFKRDHTTILHAERKIAWMIGERGRGRPNYLPNLAEQVDAKLAGEIKILIQRIRESVGEKTPG